MILKIYGNQRDGFAAHGESGDDADLEPCPFCGSHDVEISNSHTPFYSASCNGCDAQGPLGNGPSEIARFDRVVLRKQHSDAYLSALRAWNERA